MGRTTISVRRSTHERLQELKRGDEDWDDILLMMADLYQDAMGQRVGEINYAFSTSYADDPDEPMP